MNFIRVNRGSVELRNRDGILQLILCEKAQSADLSNCGKFVIITKLDGSVELRNTNGILVKSITSGGRDARFQGDDILITKSNTVELRTFEGLLIKSF